MDGERKTDQFRRHRVERRCLGINSDHPDRPRLVDPSLKARLVPHQFVDDFAGRSRWTGPTGHSTATVLDGGEGFAQSLIALLFRQGLEGTRKVLVEFRLRLVVESAAQFRQNSIKPLGREPRHQFR